MILKVKFSPSSKFKIKSKLKMMNKLETALKMIKPPPPFTSEEELERRAAKIASKLTTKGHLMENVVVSLGRG